MRSEEEVRNVLLLLGGINRQWSGDAAVVLSAVIYALNWTLLDEGGLSLGTVLPKQTTKEVSNADSRAD